MKCIFILLITVLQIGTTFSPDVASNLELLKDAQQTGKLQREIEFRSNLIHLYFWKTGQYELALEQCDIQYRQLQNISVADMPNKELYMLQIAHVYYDFKDYKRVIFYLEEVLKDSITESSQVNLQGARNTLGLCYRYGFRDFDRSDSCFRAILQTKYINPEQELARDCWDAIAEGNIGRNMILRGEYEKAIPLLKSSIEKILKYNDYGYAAGPAINLAIAYLKKGDTKEAKHYIDLTTDFYAITQRISNLPLIYETKSKYYAAIGNPKLCIAYMDSLLAENKKIEEEYNTQQLLRTEQRKHLSEQKIKDEQLYAEKIKSDGYLRSLIITFIALLVIGGGLVRYVILYRKKREAYHELVRRSQEWAHVETGFKPAPTQQPEQPDDSLENDSLENDLPEQPEQPDETDLSVMKEIEKIMEEEKLYIETTLSMDLLAQKLGSKRHYVSTAINRCANKSFNTFINEYRIKEAIQLLSQKNTNKFTIDTIAFHVGFKDRYNFYRVFKKITGLSPMEFRQNTE